MAYTFIFMKNSDTSKSPLTFSVDKSIFWLLAFLFLILLTLVFYYFSVVRKPEALGRQLGNLSELNYSLRIENDSLKSKIADMDNKNVELTKLIETEQIKSAELQAQANIVEKIKQESLAEIEQYRQQVTEKEKMIEFFNDLIKPAIKKEMQCFNMNVKFGKKNVDYGINLMLDKKAKKARSFNVEFRLLSGKDNQELAADKIMELAPDTIRNIKLQNSLRLTGKIKHNNKLKGIKVLDVRVFNQTKNMVAQCWKVF